MYRRNQGFQRASAGRSDGLPASQQSARAARASQIRSRPTGPSAPRRVVSTLFGTAARLSNEATLSRSMPSSLPSGMQVGMSRIVLGRAAGYRVWVTSRDGAKRERAVELGAHQAFENGARLPERVDAVMETVGAATWSHSLRSLRQGGSVVISGATSGPNPKSTELNRIFFLQLRVIGSTMGTREELERLIRFCETTGVRPVVDTVLPLEQARDGFAKLEQGDVVGKIVLTRP